MFVDEARWIERQLSAAALPDDARVLDLGSSTLEYRTRIQPHIAELIYRPLQRRGCRITSADVKKGEGIDLVVDLTRPGLSAELAGRHFDLVICSNTLQHVSDRQVLAANAVGAVAPGGLLLMTAPRRYRRTTDPIDNMYRPDVADLLALIRRHGRAEALAADVISIDDRSYYSFASRRILDHLLLRSLRASLRWYLPPLRWRVTCLLARVMPPDPAS